MMLAYYTWMDIACCTLTSRYIDMNYIEDIRYLSGWERTWRKQA
jgi:hypothetical protein